MYTQTDLLIPFDGLQFFFLLIVQFKRNQTFVIQLNTYGVQHLRQAIEIFIFST